MQKWLSAFLLAAVMSTMALAGTGEFNRKGCPGKIKCPITQQVICKTQCPLHK